MNGDEVQAARFLRARGSNRGYDEPQVDGLLRRVASELDAGRPAGPAIVDAAFGKQSWWAYSWTERSGYDIDAVDWFLDHLRRSPVPAERAGLSPDPWHALPVAQVTRGGGTGDPSLPAWNRRNYFAEECASAWRDFGRQPGTYLRWERVKRADRRQMELRTADQQTIASVEPGRGIIVGGRSFTFNIVGGRSLTFNPRKISASSSPDSWPPGIAELAACHWRDCRGGYAAQTMKRAPRAKAGWVGEIVDETGTSPREPGRFQLAASWVGEIVDETGNPVLYSTGFCSSYRAYGRITFPDQQWLRMLVRGTKRANAIMTAVDQTGSKVARYREVDRRPLDQGPVEIAVHPHRKLTAELVLAIWLSVQWLGGYFTTK